MPNTPKEPFTDEDANRSDLQGKSAADPGLGEAAQAFGAALWRLIVRALVALTAFSKTFGAAALTAGRSGAAQANKSRRKMALLHARRKKAKAAEAEMAPVPVAPAARKQPRKPSRLAGAWSALSFRKIVGGLTALVVLGIVGAVVFAVATLPDLDNVKPGAETRLIFADAKGEPLIARGSVPMDYADAERIPDTLRDAVIAVEDQRFYEHGGLDVRATLRAAWRNMRAGEVVEGGSTLTQQLVKITYLEPDRTFRRKWSEAFLARQVEKRFTKEEILTRYLNSVYLGAGATGMPAAAQVYFGVDISELSLAQSAALAAMIRAPSAVNPFSDMAKLRERASLVIGLMLRQERIDKNAANAARAELVTMAPQRSTASYGSWFTDWVVQESNEISTGFDGIVTLRTSLDPDKQAAAEDAVRTIMDQANSPAEAALISMTPSGEIVAMVGGRDYDKSQFNRATDALRSPGSTFKTFVYLTALAQGASPNDKISDAPLDLDGYSPENFDGDYRGNVTLAEAFARSLNAATVRLAMMLGMDRVIETARALGIEAELSETPALALGASGVTLLDMVEAYAGIASGVTPVKGRGIQGITSEEDATFLKFKWPTPEKTDLSERLMAAKDDMTRMLALVVSDGTGQAAALPGGAVGKTGTSQDYRDALFIGWNDSLITGVWVGNDDNSPMDGVTGGKLPAAIWQQFMADATDQKTDLPKLVPPATSAKAPAGTEGDAPATIRLTRPSIAAESTGPTCNISACQRAYRSFRASDCTFQPYRGRRKLCTK